MVTKLEEKKIEEIAERTTWRVIHEVLSDPDEGLSLRPEFEKRLKKSILSRKAGRLKSFREILPSLQVNG